MRHLALALLLALPLATPAVAGECRTEVKSFACSDDADCRRRRDSLAAEKAAWIDERADACWVIAMTEIPLTYHGISLGSQVTLLTRQHRHRPERLVPSDHR